MVDPLPVVAPTVPRNYKLVLSYNEEGWDDTANVGKDNYLNERGSE